ncbi:GNAT family N-acetyltransferase [Ruminococcaceae bacterium OttesenSCG-928-D13]|nr:GNAT family N-acetyltransferase [Ruminococcaceae bacterium OttesenSCG-928-D13]
MKIRTAKLSDLPAMAAVEAACFPPAEAATEASLKARLSVYPEHFWLLEDEDGTLVSFVNGMVSDEPTIRDEMFENANLHDESGAWQAIFGVGTAPEYRRRGLAAKVMEHAIAEAKRQGRKGCVLTCKAHLVHYYEKFGYVNAGLSASTHGGAVWYDMRLTF